MKTSLEQPGRHLSYFEVSARHSLSQLPYLAIGRAEIHEQLDLAQDVEAQSMEEPDSQLIARYWPDLELLDSACPRCSYDGCGELPPDADAAVGLAHHEGLQLGFSFAGDQACQPDELSAYFGDPNMFRAYPIEVLVEMEGWIGAAYTGTLINMAMPLR
jgi:hypothetical protein